MGFLVSLPLQASGFQLGLKHGLAPGLLYLTPCLHVPEAVLTTQGLPECRGPGVQPFPTDRLGDGRQCAGTSTEQGELCRVLVLLGFSKSAPKVAAAQLRIRGTALSVCSFIGMQSSVWSCLKLNSIWPEALLKEDIVLHGWIWGEVSRASLQRPVQLEFLTGSHLHSRHSWARTLEKRPAGFSALLCSTSWAISVLETSSYPRARPRPIPKLRKVSGKKWEGYWIFTDNRSEVESTEPVHCSLPSWPCKQTSKG